MDELISKMVQDAKSTNKHLTEEYLKSLHFNTLLCFVNPLNRDDYIYMRQKQVNIINY